ncbi:MAG: hypothetical protein LBI11_01015 [Streptococcaceae bacterium]|jgi:hypothetical protein|nr:hypothetical protein [Streptococcaceae bacterium]
MKNERLKTGDLIGVSGIESDWGAAIVASSKDATHAQYDHVGMLEVTPRGLFVWNANPHLGVAREELSAFVAREEAEVSKLFGLYRLKKMIDFDAVLTKMRALLDLPYNFSFIQSENSYYCSDFIARTFPAAIFPLEAMHFEGDFWTLYYEKLGISEIPEGKIGIHPSDLLASPKLVTLGDLDKL